MDSEEKAVIDSILLIEAKAKLLVEKNQKEIAESASRKDEALRKAREREYKTLLDKEKLILEDFEKDKAGIIAKSSEEKEKIDAKMRKLFEKNYKAGKEFILKKVS